MNQSLTSAAVFWTTNMSIAFTALRSHPLRSILTALGVMIGVLAVVLAVAVGDGAKNSVVDSINQLGSNMAIVLPQPENRGGSNMGERGRLTERDAEAIQRMVPGVNKVAPQLRYSVQLVIAGRNATTTAIGITPAYSQVAGAHVDAGRPISEVDVRTGARVMVIGSSVASRLFGDSDPLAQSVRVNRVPFTVIGVLESKGSSFGSDNDDLALVPISTARQRLVTSAPQGPDDLNVLFVGFEEGANLTAAKRQMVQVLRTRNNVAAGDINPFTINTTEEFIKQTGVVTAVLQAVLVAIASIALLVGGIGIMNIMLVSVTERTREIGLRMALGAKRRDIRRQFLFEAAALCTLGGSIGLILALLAAQAFERFAGFSAPIGADTAIAAIMFSALIGILFGIYPAMRASRQSPIQALRTE